MEAKPSVETPDPVVAGRHLLGKWPRVYLHGCIALVVIYAAAYVVSLLVPIFDFVDAPGLAIAISILTILVAPPLIGSIILYGIVPWLGRKEAWRGLEAWDDRVISTISSAHAKSHIVVLNWPSTQIRTMGVLTSTFKSPDSDRQLASVYVPTAPHTRFGYIRIVSLDDVELTEWTLKQWQLYQLTFGALSPDQIAISDDEGVGESI